MSKLRHSWFAMDCFPKEKVDVLVRRLETQSTMAISVDCKYETGSHGGDCTHPDNINGLCKFCCWLQGKNEENDV